MPELIEPVSAWYPRAQNPVELFVKDYPFSVLIAYGAPIAQPPGPLALRTIDDQQLKRELAEKELKIKLSRLTPDSKALYLQGPRADYTIGRSPNNHIAIPRQKVSGLHAKIMCFEDGKVKLKDVSKNGTLVGEKICHKTELDLGDKTIISIADAEFLFYFSATFHKILNILS